MRNLTWLLLILAIGCSYQKPPISKPPAKLAGVSLRGKVAGNTFRAAPQGITQQTQGVTIQQKDVTITGVKVVIGTVTLFAGPSTSPISVTSASPAGAPYQAQCGMCGGGGPWGWGRGAGGIFGGNPGDNNDNGGSRDDATGNSQKQEPPPVFQGPFVLDLVNGVLVPDASPLAVPPGPYARVDIVLQVLTPGEAIGIGLPTTDSVVGHSYVIEALLNNVTIPDVVTDATAKLIAYGDQPDAFQVNLEKAIDLTADNLNELLLVFNADGWFPSSLLGQLRAGLQDGSVTYRVDVDGTPVVVLDANENQGLTQEIQKAFRQSVGVGKP